MWGEPTASFEFRVYQSISTHSPRVGRTGTDRKKATGVSHFNSLAPCGANLSFLRASLPLTSFQLTRPVWGEPFGVMEDITTALISTHSPRVGRTRQSCIGYQTSNNFNSLAPCGANLGYFANEYDEQDFNSLAPCGANHSERFEVSQAVHISTHSPRVGRTRTTHYSMQLTSHFNSLAPCGANLGEREGIRALGDFNSLAPCGANLGDKDHCDRAKHFNSLAPCGANLRTGLGFRSRNTFQLTRPVWGEPKFFAQPSYVALHFNSLAPCGANPDILPLDQTIQHFNSLAPCGANRRGIVPERIFRIFQLTRPVWGEPH